MVKEAYVSFEVAKLLKEKGFNEKCLASYWTDGSLTQSSGITNSITSNLVTAAPTHQFACAWLREKGFTFIISPQWAEGDMRNPCRWYWEIRGLKDNTVDVYSQPLCDSYEEAVEAALLYVLNNLI